MVNSIIVENDGEYKAVEGMGADRDPSSLSKEEILELNRKLNKIKKK